MDGRDTTSHQLALRILATSDLHAHLTAFDYEADRPSDSVGLSRTASLIRAARAEQANTLLFDCGDLLLGTVLGEMARSPEGGTGGAPGHPMIAAMNAIGYDGASLGNHDLDFGFDFACAAYGSAQFPLVASNLSTLRAGDRGPVRAFDLVERAFAETSGRTVKLRVGLLGLLPPQTAEWARDAVFGRVQLTDMVAAARSTAAILRERGADLVVALAHTGLPRPDGSDADENAALALAGVGDIDVLLLGHSHKVFPVPGPAPQHGVDCARGTIGGKPSVMPGLFGSHLGVIDLLLAGRPGAWRIGGFEVSARPIAMRTGAREAVALVADDPVVHRLAAPFHKAARDRSARPVGRTRVALHSYFALVANSAAMALIAEAQEWWASARLAGTKLEGLPVVSAVSPLKAGGRAGPTQYSDVPAGPMNMRHIDDLYPFPNTLCAVAVTGAELRDFIDRAASVFARIVPGPEEQVLLDDDTPSYMFDILTGLTYGIDITRPPRDPRADPPAASRVVGLSYAGRPVSDGDRFALLSNSHRLSGPAIRAREADGTFLRGDDLCRDILRDYVRQGTEIAPRARPTWHFAGAAGTTVVFSTGPGSARHLDEPDVPAVRPCGHTPNGFLRYRMVL